VGALTSGTGNGHEFAKGGDLRRLSAHLSVAWRGLDSVTMLAGVGSALGGDLQVDGDRHVIQPGPCGTFGIGWRAFAQEDGLPYVVIGFALSISSSLTEHAGSAHRLTAFDVRPSLIVGWLFADQLGPYFALRSLTGPVIWELDGRQRTTRPTESYQLGAWVSASAGSIDAFFEIAPLGERAAIIGAGWSF